MWSNVQMQCVHATTYPVSLPSPRCTLHEISEETRRIWSALMSHVRTKGGSKKAGVIKIFPPGCSSLGQFIHKQDTEAVLTRMSFSR